MSGGPRFCFQLINRLQADDKNKGDHGPQIA